MTATDNSAKALADSLNGLLADCFALYLKTKNFHWHVRGPRFRDLHLLFDEQAAEVFALTDLIAERVRKNGAATLTSIGAIAARSRIADQDDAAKGKFQKVHNQFHSELFKRLANAVTSGGIIAVNGDARLKQGVCRDDTTGENDHLDTERRACAESCSRYRRADRARRHPCRDGPVARPGAADPRDPRGARWPSVK